MSNEIVQVINRGATTFRFSYGKAPYELHPDGVPRAVPVDALKLAIGDWDARDTEHDKAREMQRKMVNTRFGLLGAPWYSEAPRETVGLKHMVPPEPTEMYTPAPDELVEGRYAYMHPSLPRLEVRDFDGNRVYTLLDDPDGDLVNGRRRAKVETASEQALLAALDAEKRKTDALISALTRLNPELANELALENNAARKTDAAHDPLALSTPAPDVAPESRPDAMDVMNEALGLAGPESASGASDPIDPPRPARKGAAKKAPAPRPSSEEDEL